MSDRRPLVAVALAFAACATTPAAPPAERWRADLDAYRARRELDPHQLGFALGEALAHLRFLEDAGRVVRQVGDDGVHRFLKA